MTAWTNTAPPICGPRNRNKKGEQKLREPTFVCAVNTVTEVWARQERYERRRSCEVHTHTHTQTHFLCLWHCGRCPFSSVKQNTIFIQVRIKKKKRVQLTLKKTLFTILIRGLFYFDMQTVGPVHSYIIWCVLIYMQKYISTHYIRRISSKSV